MTRPVEPTWPTVRDVQTGHVADNFCTFTARQAIDMCRAAWLAANDDPSADLPGTVRTSPDGKNIAVRNDDDSRERILWYAVVGRSNAKDRRWGWSNDNVRGWTFTCNIPGTPAWDAAQAAAS